MINIVTYIILILITYVMISLNKEVNKLRRQVVELAGQLAQAWTYIANISNQTVINSRTIDKITTKAEGRHAGEDRTSYEN